MNAERFWSRVDKSGGPDACWLWTGAVNVRSGYGQLAWGGTTASAHRVAYELTYGPIPEGMTIDHVWQNGCRHRHCVNAEAHLEAVTQAENLRRSQFTVAATNARKTRCKYDHPFDEANTYHTSRGTRQCRECYRMRDRARRAKRVAA